MIQFLVLTPLSWKSNTAICTLVIWTYRLDDLKRWQPFCSSTLFLYLHLVWLFFQIPWPWDLTDPLLIPFTCIYMRVNCVSLNNRHQTKQWENTNQANLQSNIQNCFYYKVNVLYYRLTANTNGSMIPYNITLYCFIIVYKKNNFKVALSRK